MRKKMTKDFKNQNGQILVGFLLVMVLGITLTLSLASRTTTDIRTTTTTEQSSRAYNASEAGVEDALKKVEGGQIVPSNTPVSISGNVGLGVTGQQTTYNYTVTNVGANTKAFVFPKPLLSDEVAQVWLADSASNSPVYTFPQIKVYWGNDGSSISATTPALEITLVYKNKTTGSYGSEKWYYRPSGSGIPSGFNPASEVVVGTQTINAADNNLGTDQKFLYSLNEGGTGGLNIGKINFSASDPILLRFRMLYNNDVGHLLAVIPSNPTDPKSQLPSQGYQVDSTGVASSGATRRINVFRSYPTTGSIFDFALFSGSSQKALKK